MTTHILKHSPSEITELISRLGLSTLSKEDSDQLKLWMFMSPNVWKGIVNDRLLCVWGLIPPTLLSDQAYLWLITTEAAAEHEFVLVRQSQIEIKKMLTKYPRIVGHCEATSPRSIRWLKWLGAVFGDPVDRLIPFVIRRA